MSLPTLGDVNAAWTCSYRYRGRTCREIQTYLGAARASITLKVPIGGTITQQDPFCGIRKYRVIATGGGDRTQDGRWVQRA